LSHFKRKYYNLRSHETKIIDVRCLDKKIMGTSLLRRRETEFNVRLEMIQEKLEELKSTQDAFGCIGCSEECPLNLKLVFATLVEQSGGPKAKRMFSYILEWDHADPLDKTGNVTNIFNKAERLAELAMCTLRCVFCHRLKTYKNGDAGNPIHSHGRRSERYKRDLVTQKALQDKLEFRKRRLDDQGTDGRCPGPGVEGGGG
jgi:hypothetical protein